MKTITTTLLLLLSSPVLADAPKFRMKQPVRIVVDGYQVTGRIAVVQCTPECFYSVQYIEGDSVDAYVVTVPDIDEVKILPSCRK